VVKGNQFTNAEDAPVCRGLDASDLDKLDRDGHWNEAYFEQVKAWVLILSAFPFTPRVAKQEEKDYLLLLPDTGTGTPKTGVSGLLKFFLRPISTGASVKLLPIPLP
jgi:hypothetical protein